jgi:hypothetical protein
MLVSLQASHRIHFYQLVEQGEIMKNTLMLIILAAAMLMVLGCAHKEVKPEASSGEAAAQEEEVAPTEAAAPAEENAAPAEEAAPAEAAPAQ